jgi:hypothetical protein
MNDLEVWAQRRLGRCVQPDASVADLARLEPIPDEADMIVRWLLKTAIIVERAFPMGTTAKIPPALYPVARGTRPPTDCYAWAGYILEPGFDLHLVPGFPVHNGRVLHPFQVHAESLNFAIQLNHLALQLFRCPDATPGFKLALRLEDQNCPVVPVWLTMRAPFTEPSLPVFPNFAYLRDVLEVHSKPSNG